MITVAFDIDGTVVDVWERYWRIYAESVKTHGAAPVPFDRYRAEVRRGTQHYRIFDEWHTRELYEAYLAFRQSRLEASEYLRLDRVVRGMDAALRSLAGQFRLIAVSARDDAPNLRQQLTRLGLAPLFADVHATGLHGGAPTKARVLHQEDAVLLVGDTEVDVQAAALANIPPMPVAWGLRDVEFIRRHTDRPSLDSPRELTEACMTACAVLR